MTTYIGKKMATVVVAEDDKFLKDHAQVVIHGGFMDRVLGDHLDKRIPHRDLPHLSCPIVDTTTIDDSHDEQMFGIIRKLVEQVSTVDVPLLIIELEEPGRRGAEVGGSMTTPAGSTIPGDVLITDLKPPRFLKVDDLTDRWRVQQLAVTISRLTYEETVPNPKDLDPDTKDERNPRGKPRVILAPVLYFKTKAGTEFPRGMLLGARINITNLRLATGAKTVGELIDKRITIQAGEHKGRPALRISPAAPTNTAAGSTQPQGGTQS